jgi:hypothetical protein
MRAYTCARTNARAHYARSRAVQLCELEFLEFIKDFKELGLEVRQLVTIGGWNPQIRRGES